MKRIFLFLFALLVACTVPPAAVIQDGNLAVLALNTLNDDAKLLGAPARDSDAIAVASKAVQTALADLQKGIKTPQDFAAAVNDQVSVLAPTLLADFKANQTITTGVVLLQQLVLVIAAEVTANQSAAPPPPPTARSFNARAELQIWVLRHHK